MEEAGSSSAGFSRNWERERFSRPSCRARNARSLRLSAKEPTRHVELPAFQSKVQPSMCPPSSPSSFDGDKRARKATVLRSRGF